MKSSTLIVGLIALVIGLGGGMLLSGGNNDSNPSVASAQTDTKAAGLRVLLNNLEAQHVDLASAAVRAGFDGDKSFTASAAALDKNSQDIASAVGSVYGDEAGDKFYEIWNSHIGFFVDYTVAAKKGDKAGMDKAVQNLNGYVDAVAAFLSGANSNLPNDAVKMLVSEHVGLLKQAVDSYGSGDYEGSYSAQQQAREQITTKIADTLAGAIVKQKPENFKD